MLIKQSEATNGNQSNNNSCMFTADEECGAALKAKEEVVKGLPFRQPKHKAARQLHHTQGSPRSLPPCLLWP
jgi:hypothetical protein